MMLLISCTVIIRAKCREIYAGQGGEGAANNKEFGIVRLIIKEVAGGRKSSMNDVKVHSCN